MRIMSSTSCTVSYVPTVVGLWPFRINKVCATFFKLLAPFHNGWKWHCMWPFTVDILRWISVTFCPYKKYYSPYFNIEVSFQLTCLFFPYYAATNATVLLKLQPLETVELNYRLRKLCTCLAMLPFEGGTSVIYFLNDYCTSINFIWIKKSLRLLKVKH